MNLSLYSGKLFKQRQQAVTLVEHCTRRKAICLVVAAGALRVIVIVRKTISRRHGQVISK